VINLKILRQQILSILLPSTILGSVVFTNLNFPYNISLYSKNLESNQIFSAAKAPLKLFERINIGIEKQTKFRLSNIFYVFHQSSF
jgi:ABC-type iron transport system FetAB ATPase subunit